MSQNAPLNPAEPEDDINTLWAAYYAARRARKADHAAKLGKLDIESRRRSVLIAAAAQRRAPYAARRLGAGSPGFVKDLNRQERLRRSPGGRNFAGR
jgi:hypothetical protein